MCVLHVAVLVIALDYCGIQYVRRRHERLNGSTEDALVLHPIGRPAMPHDHHRLIRTFETNLRCMGSV